MHIGIQNGIDLLKSSVYVFKQHPKIIVPLLFTWTLYSPLVLYLKYWFDWTKYTDLQIILIAIGSVFLLAFLLAFACSVLLELIQQIESGESTSLFKAFLHTLGKNTFRMLPIVVIWSFVWFILLVLQVIFSNKNKRSGEAFSLEGAAKTFTGYSKFSFSRAFFQALIKAIRMSVFFMLPAISWENVGFWKAVKKGVAVIRLHAVEFSTGYMLTGLAAAIIYLPPALLYWFADTLIIDYPEWVWLMIIVYSAFAWSYTIYLEQMFAAELYLWHRKWREVATDAERDGLPVPTLRDIPRPSILDGVHDLLKS